MTAMTTMTMTEEELQRSLQMPNKLLVSAACLAFLFGCASSKKTDSPPPAASSGSKTTPAPAASGSKAAPAPARTDGRKVKSKDGKVDGEIFGTPGAKSKFARLEIGMSRTAAEKLIGVPDDSDTHITGGHAYHRQAVHAVLFRRRYAALRGLLQERGPVDLFQCQQIQRAGDADHHIGRPQGDRRQALTFVGRPGSHLAGPGAFHEVERSLKQLEVLPVVGHLGAVDLYPFPRTRHAAGLKRLGVVH